jgi:hypothetical protein
MADRSAIHVARRCVFYIPGYDPFHPRRYRELYRKESAAQAEISGYDISLSPAADRTGYGWQVSARIENRDVRSSIEVLVWSDIVRSSMSDGIAATYLQLAKTAWAYIGSGAIFRLVRLRKGPAIAALYPIVMLLAQLALAAASFALIRALTITALDLADIGLSGHFSDAVIAGLKFWAGSAAGLVMAAGVLSWFKSKDKWLYAYYLMHDYAFTAQHQGANPPVLEERLKEFGERIAAALQEDWDEVLVVGHSSGAHLAISVLADLIRSGAVPKEATLAFLSLGHVVPMASFLPKAQRLRGDLAYLSARGELTWIDVTAPGDGCAFALCDPVSVTGVAPIGKMWPLVISAAFTQTLSPERWRELRWRFFRLHFQYLCAFDRPGDYDYFQITAGPKTLADRFKDRAASKSRIDLVANPFRDVA